MLVVCFGRACGTSVYWNFVYELFEIEQPAMRRTKNDVLVYPTQLLKLGLR